MHAHWTFEKYPKYTHEKSPYFKYKHLPIIKRINSLDRSLEKWEASKAIFEVATKAVSANRDVRY